MNAQWVLPSLQDVEAAIHIPARYWKSRCLEISAAIVKTGLVPNGRTVYGHYRGDVKPHTMFYQMWLHTGFVRHGWISLADGSVVDATRWVFERKRPYLYYGHNNEDYDESGNVLRAQLLTPPPVSPSGDMYQLRLSVKARRLVTTYFPDSILSATSKFIWLATNQCLWLANVPWDALHEGQREIYLALARVGLKALIPIDNWERAMYEW